MKKNNGRKLIKTYGNLGLVDFYSERFNGEERFITLTDKSNFMLSDNHLEDLHKILGKTYVYILQNSNIEEVKLQTSLL